MVDAADGGPAKEPGWYEDERKDRPMVEGPARQPMTWQQVLVLLAFFVLVGFVVWRLT